MTDCDTLSAVLRRAAGTAGTITYLDSSAPERTVAFREVYTRALGLLHHFQNAGMAPGAHVILLVNRNEQFVDAFWACQLGGLIPVPVAVANTPGNRLRLLRIWAALETPWLCTTEAVLERYAGFARDTGHAPALDTMRARAVLLDRITDTTHPGAEASPNTEQTALIQFSSGSTRAPKGVVLTHRNLLTNIRAIIAGIHLGADDSAFSWMPMTHDMGLIALHLTPTACGIDHVLMATEMFIRRPHLWLTRAAKKRSTVLCSPNFGYQLFLKSVDPTQLEGMDLSAVRLVTNGAEPISVPLCRKFLARMAPYGLGAQVMFPVYGLAEASVAVTFAEPGAALRVHWLGRDSLQAGGPVRRCAEGDPSAVPFPCVGRPIRDCELTLRDAAGTDVAEGVIGHVLIRGPNVTAGYYGRERLDRSAYTPDGWLNTGDLGFLDDGELTIIGRSKEVIFVNGQNLFPHDVEALLCEHAALAPGRVAACGVPDAATGAEELLIFVTFREGPERFVPVARRVRQALTEQLGLARACVIPVSRIPQTTSGKFQRYQLAERYAAGEFAAVLEDLATRMGPGADDAAGSGTDVEQNLQDICRRCIDGVPIGLHDNIFEFGTSSLTLARIYEEIEQRYPDTLEITDFFDYPTIAQLAAHIRSRPPRDPEPAPARAPRRPRDEHR
ncbi:MAG: hypothetical protein B7Z66_08170 [Chromatiales bacterium 21-64-14]|nr:MAG: hypothetical protein B7Z66_08170 [Chromatiales bacterium 21-64-14]HQU15312.1 non-ribosomal peptide synthetase [Gammaproteobacteria bacterium]